MDKRLLDDLAELAGGAMGVLASLRQQMQDETRGRMDKVADRLDLVTRTEFDRAMGMLAKARAVQEDILKRLAALEGKSGSKAPPAAKAKAAAKKKSTTKKK